MLTNAPARLLSAEEVLVVVRLRWQIEWLFRLWKEHGHLDEWRSLDPWRILCELYAKLTAMVIQHWLITAGCWQDPHRSLVKAAQVVRREAGRLMMALCEGNLEQVIGSILQCMQAGCRLIEKAGGKVASCAFLVELTFLKGRDRLQPHEVFSLIQF